jgi:hypothetical protein
MASLIDSIPFLLLQGEFKGRKTNEGYSFMGTGELWI